MRKFYIVISTKEMGLEPPPSRGTFSGFWQNVEYSYDE
jgi:hypothetical protein